MQYSSWRQTDLPELAVVLASRPGHEAVRTQVTEILRHGFGAGYEAFSHEVRLPEVRGRADLLFGATVFEFKSDLRREAGDVVARLPDYLAERQRQTGRRYLGIATDGATFIAYELREGALIELTRHEVRAATPDALLHWLEPALSDRDELHPEPLVFQRELGRDSLTFGRARLALAALWDRLRSHPEVGLKRELWDGLLREAYGSPVGDDVLFLQHTYLTIVAKTLAARVLDLPVDDAEDVLSGQALRDAGIQGAVEGDFFDWVLLEADGRDLVLRLARQVARFRLRDVEADVLKALYESLIDPAQRRDLGEYYTPDWLAAKLVAATLSEPLTAVVLDPACGSGTFLFHALRRLLAAAREAGWSDARTVREAALRVRGLDVHPVAVIIARVTWLLALGEAIRERDGDLHVPVYLGDAMQWSLSQIGGLREIMLPVPGEGPLHIPAGIAENQSQFEPALREVSQGLEDDAEPERVEQALARIAGVQPADAAILAQTFARIRSLKRAGRNGIWPFILRNLIRPVWLSRPDQRADLLIGNPPWVAYRHLSPEMKVRMRDACHAMNLWVGGVLATQQDLAALFWARGAERYLKPGGTIAFVLPYAALNRPAFEGLRRGVYVSAEVRITAAWNLSLLREIFPTSSCVLIGKRAPAGAQPAEVTQFTGVIRRDAGEPEADNSLTQLNTEWPAITTLAGASVYRSRFTNGATVYPRRFFLVQREHSGRLGASQASPRMRGKQGPMDRAPWLHISPPAGPIEVEFLRRLLLGENILPFRMTEVALAVLPIYDRSIINSDAARATGHRHLASWLQDIETKWAAHASRRSDGALRMTIQQRIDHMRGITLQIAAPGPKIVYTKAGTRLSAALVEDASVIVENSAYWAPIGSMSEAHYLCTVINSDTVLQRIIPMQPRGWRDPRHFDNLVWELPIPEYDGGLDLHRRLATAGAEAERIAATVALPEGDFRRKRRAVRDALAATGHAGVMEALVATLLGD